MTNSLSSVFYCILVFHPCVYCVRGCVSCLLRSGHMRAFPVCVRCVLGVFSHVDSFSPVQYTLHVCVCECFSPVCVVFSPVDELLNLHAVLKPITQYVTSPATTLQYHQCITWDSSTLVLARPWLLSHNNVSAGRWKALLLCNIYLF